jgi:uncharacterized protein YceH (UPF0502 family)
VSPETGVFAGVSRLSSTEIRVLGCLMEKQRTTPDIYPLSLNSLRLACNQSTNRDPVVQYDDAMLRDALHRLERRGYTRLASGAGSRTAKHRHLLAEALPMGADEQAVMCVLMLRGPQTPGELKQRTDRMHPFADLGGVHETLERLIGRGLVAVLERRPGQKEERYVQLLGAAADQPAATGPGGSRAAAPPSPASSPGAPSEPIRMARQLPDGALPALEERVARLEREMTRLRAELGETPGEESGHARADEDAGKGAELEEAAVGETLEWT